MSQVDEIHKALDLIEAWIKKEKKNGIHLKKAKEAISAFQALKKISIQYAINDNLLEIKADKDNFHYWTVTDSKLRTRKF